MQPTNGVAVLYSSACSARLQQIIGIQTNVTLKYKPSSAIKKNNKKTTKHKPVSCNYKKCSHDFIMLCILFTFLKGKQNNVK